MKSAGGGGSPKIDHRLLHLYILVMYNDAECQAVQDLLELDSSLEYPLNDPEKIKKYFFNVKTKLKNRPVVEFPTNCQWFNSSQPWTSRHLRGRLTLLDFWTYCCINCMQVLPDLEVLEEEFGDENVTVIGVHSAKFDNEKVGDNISNAISRYDIHHPVINDEQIHLWNNLSISCWPTIVSERCNSD